jgi:hypothetical protein
MYIYKSVGLYMICPMLMIVDLEFETKAKFYCSLWFLNMRCDNVC